MSAKLSCCFSSLPGNGLGDKVSLARDLDLAVDYEFRSRAALERFAEEARRREVACPCILAYGCHGLNPLSDPGDRERFIAHVLEAGKGAEIAGSSAVLTAVYEKQCVAGAGQIAAGIYGTLSRELPGKEILVECLTATRTVFLPDVFRLGSFLAGLDGPGVGLAVDTWHAWHTEKDLGETLEQCAAGIRAVHLKDSGSLLPGKGSLDFDLILGRLRAGGYRGRFTVECRVPGSVSAFEEAVRGLHANLRRMFGL
jgi:hypothetical protein